MDTVGYTTLADADLYVSTHFVYDDPIRQQWESLEESDRCVYLQRSFDIIETLPFRGRKYSKEQIEAFPRWPLSTVPRGIINAQIENAVALANTADTDEDTEFYNSLWRFGVESYKIGNLSETSGNGAWGHVEGAPSIKDVVSTHAVSLLKPYLMGGYRIE